MKRGKKGGGRGRGERQTLTHTRTHMQKLLMKRKMVKLWGYKRKEQSKITSLACPGIALPQICGL